MGQTELRFNGVLRSSRRMCAGGIMFITLERAKAQEERNNHVRL
jgi:hypothetical protein